MIPVYWLFCRSEKRQGNWRAVALAMAIQVVVSGLWCSRNYVYEHVFTPSRVSIDNLHNFMRPRVEEWVKVGGLPADLAVVGNRKAALANLSQEIAGMPAKEALDLMATKSMAVFRAHPLVTLQVLLQNANENAISGWDYFHRQLPLGALMVKRLFDAAHKESLFRQGALITIALFYCCLLILIRRRQTATNCRMFALVSALMLVYGYFAVISGTTFWTGSRIMYPVEIAMILLVVLALQAVGTGCRKLFEQMRFLSLPIPGPVRQGVPWLMVLLILCAGVVGTRIFGEGDTVTSYNFGVALANRGNTMEAIPFFEQALQFSPENLQAKFELAHAYTNLKQPEEAIRLLREILQVDPNDANANWLLGVSLVDYGRVQEGISHIQEALRLNPSLDKARKALNEFMDRIETELPEEKTP